VAGLFDHRVNLTGVVLRIDENDTIELLDSFPAMRT